MSRVTNAIITAHVGPQGHSDPEIDSVNRFLRGTDGGGGGEFMPRDLRQCPFAQHPPAPAAPNWSRWLRRNQPKCPRAGHCSHQKIRWSYVLQHHMRGSRSGCRAAIVHPLHCSCTPQAKSCSSIVIICNDFRCLRPSRICSKLIQIETRFQIGTP